MRRDRFGCLNVWPFRPSIYFYGELAELLVYVTIRHGKFAFHLYFGGYRGGKEYLLITVAGTLRLGKPKNLGRVAFGDHWLLLIVTGLSL